MTKFWKAFGGGYPISLNGNPIGCYEEAHALFASSLARERHPHRRTRYDGPPGMRLSKRRLMSARDMGSNVSRRSGKGLSGRRAQSSGSLYRMLAPRVGKVFGRCGDGVRQRDRNKLSGSLPNHLDEKRRTSGGSSPESPYHRGSNHQRLHRKPDANKDAFRFCEVQDVGAGDQGYASEWSPEDELPLTREPSAMFRHSMVKRTSDVAFITKENVFEVKFEKGSMGLGLSVTGGIDTNDPYPGLIRIKRIFPHQPAWECGLLQLGDIILEANGTPLTGFTNYEALEVLRTTPNSVLLKICRPPCPASFIPLGEVGEPFLPPPPPKRDPNRNVLISSQSTNDKLPLPFTEPYGEFDVVLNKVNGSLGFTLRKEDESILGHYVRALVREPAISDGRIHPGDKIVSVNGTDISTMSHVEAVAFLRQSGDEVRLKLYRDPAQTPVSALSPTETHKTFRPRPVFRKEAMDMLCSLAVRKLSPKDSRNSSPRSSPRRRKLTKNAAEPEESRPKIENPGGILDAEVGAPRSEDEVDGEPTSMPAIPTSPLEFGHARPGYQSAHMVTRTSEGHPEKEGFFDSTSSEPREGTQSLLKWKGVVFGDKEKGNVGKTKEVDPNSQILTVELCKGWNSRLGFSLRNSSSKTLISAIYPDSVAAKDGRLREGDEIIMINEESIEGMATSNVIELLRKVRGATAITVIRKFQNES